jgi:hypothetical protein
MEFILTLFGCAMFAILGGIAGRAFQRKRWMLDKPYDYRVKHSPPGQGFAGMAVPHIPANRWW